MKDRENDAASNRVWLAIVLLPLVYVLASGPIFGLAFWLRESTGHDEFYCALYLYWPLFVCLPEVISENLWQPYVEWWVVDVFHTVGPG